jgi:hypothetical protein
MKRTHLMLLAAAPLVACAGNTERGEGGGAAELYRGHYTTGFEASGFGPCGSEESWWVGGHLGPVGAFLRTLPDSVQRGYPTLYVEWRGVVSAPGRYGHMGLYSRELRVDTVLVVQREAPADCR